MEDWYKLNKDAWVHYDISKDKEQQALDNEMLDSDKDEDSNGTWNISMEDIDTNSGASSMEPEETLTVREVGKGGPITQVHLLFSWALSCLLFANLSFL